MERQRLIEFLCIKYVDKFDLNNNLKFKDGTSVSKWFKLSFDNIINSSDEISKEIVKQYNFYKKFIAFINEKDIDKYNIKLKTVKFEDNVLMNIWYYTNYSNLRFFDEKYEKELIKQVEFFWKLRDFIELDDLNKFNKESKIRFNKNISAPKWYYKNINKIHECSCTGKIIESQYKKYNEGLKKEFISIKSSTKYKENKMKFNNGQSVYNWFIDNKNEILNKDDELNILIRNQYNLYLLNEEKKRKAKEKESETKVTIYDKRLEEFVNDENLNKFNRRGNVLFKDGASKGLWFMTHKENVLNGTSEYDIKVQEQYKKYKKIDIKEEFIKIADESKFDLNCTDIKLSNGVIASVWFNENKNSLFESRTKENLEIKRQYDEYRFSFDDKISEFIKEKDFNKFNCNNRSIKFSDGSIISIWFDNHKQKILLSSYEIRKQYDKYLNGATYNLRKEEFALEPNLEKFNMKKKCVYFDDGKCMFGWFKRYKNNILSNNDLTDLVIINQKKLYDSGIKYIDNDLIKERTKDLKFY